MGWSARRGWIAGGALAALALGSAAVGVWVSPVAFLLTIPSGAGAIIILASIALIQRSAARYRGPDDDAMDESEKFLAADPTLGLSDRDVTRRAIGFAQPGTVSEDVAQHPWNDPRNVDSYRRTTRVVLWVGIALVVLGVVATILVANLGTGTPDMALPLMSIVVGLIVLTAALIRWLMRDAYGAARRRRERR